MGNFSVSAAEIIDARPEQIYAVLSDYRVGHPAIVPKPYFSEFTVEQGGQGAGTVVSFTMTIFGTVSHYRQAVSEPEPGRVLKETELNTGQFTTFTLEPLNDDKQTRLIIASEFPSKPGIAGFMERLMQPPIVRRLYQQELRQIAEYMAGKNATT